MHLTLKVCVMRRLFQFLLLFFLPLFVCAQQPHEQTNAGTDFWVTDVVASYDVNAQIGYGTSEQYFQHMEDYFANHLQEPDEFSDTAYILIVGDIPCAGYAENPNTGWHIDFTVNPDHITEIRVPEEEIMCYITHDIQSKGIYIHTECNVYAYLITRKSQFWTFIDAPMKNAPQKFQIPPIQTGLEDFVLPYTVVGLQSTQNDNWSCEIFPYPPHAINRSFSQSYLVVAHEDNTEVVVDGHYEALSFMSEDTGPADIVWVPDQAHTLHRGEVLVIPMISSAQGPIFLMDSPYEVQVGIHTNCKKVSVFQHRTFYGYRYIVEAVVPFHPNLYGKDFLTLYNFFDQVEGNMCSAHCDNNEDDPMFSHNVVQEVSPTSGVINTFAENTVCYSYPFIYRYMSASSMNGMTRYIYCNNPLIAGEAAFMLAPSRTLKYTTTAVMQLSYADKQVKEAVFPIQPYDYTFGEQALAIYISTSPEGRFTTYVNGELIPDSAFIIDDPQVGRYYIAEIVFRENIPEIVKIENEKGFSASVLEERPFDYYLNLNYILASCIMYNSGCTYDLPAIRPSIGVGVTTFCANDTLRVYTEGNCENYPITWTIEDSTFTLFEPDTLLFPLTFVDTLHFTMIVEKYCPDTLIDTMYVVLHPHLYLPADTIICRGASITAQCDMFGFYQWSDGTTDSTFTPLEAGDYTVRIDNACGSDSATVYVRFYNDPLFVDFGNDTLLCELATLLLDATQQHPANYLWQDSSTNTTYTVIDDGRYWVVVTDGCTGVSDTIDVTYLYDLQIDLGPDTAVCSDRPYTLDATTPYSHYLWHDGTTAPTHEVTAPGTYSVHVYNVCTEADASVTIEVEDCEEMVHVPNAFTPNGDGQNDLFLPVFNHPDRLESYNLHIYDRWGRLLFSTDNPHQGWNCSESPAGVYVWRMEYKAASEGSKILTGSVTVVR